MTATPAQVAAAEAGVGATQSALNAMAGGSTVSRAKSEASQLLGTIKTIQVVTPPPPPPPPPPPASLTVVPMGTVNGTVGTSLSVPVVASGGVAPLSYALTAGTLPPGVTLNPSSGLVIGDPTAPLDGPVTVTVSDASPTPQQVSTTFVVDVVAAIPPPPPTGSVPAAPVATLKGTVLSFTVPASTPPITVSPNGESNGGFCVYVNGVQEVASNWTQGLPTSLDLSAALPAAWGGALPNLAPGASESVTVTAYNGSGQGPQSDAVTYTAPSVTPPPPPPPPVTGKLGLGAYAGAGNVAGVKKFASETGLRITRAADYCAGNSLASIAAGPSGWQGSGFKLALGVNMVPDSSKGSTSAFLAAGAAGTYNSTFKQLAQNLLAQGLGDTDWHPGWEWDISGYAWSLTNTTDAQNYAKFFQQIYTTAKAVSSAFRLFWYYGLNQPNLLAAAYPGDAFCDGIDFDQYDQAWVTPLTPANAWTGAILPALNSLAAFGKAHGKPLSLGEWGVITRPDGHGLGDDPSFITNLLDWVMANNVDHIVYQDFNDGEDSSIEDKPNSLAELKSMAAAVNAVSA